MLKINNLVVKVKSMDKQILNGLDLEVKSGEIHCIMGRNGSGKSTLGHVIMGNPEYEIIDGQIYFENELINDLPTNERAIKGIYLAFQNPIEIPGVTLTSFFRYTTKKFYPQDMPYSKIRKEIVELLHKFGIPEDTMKRYLNEGFSGGERKRIEAMQVLVYKPKLAILDEIDSGLDIDGLKSIVRYINEYVEQNPNTSIIFITHYSRLLQYLSPNRVHVMINGKIVASGDISLAREIDEKGYLWLENNVGA
ncbi:MAG: Fe-S cluster assembly ATPase SufC [Candidatus Calescibacterium sp.]|nr:Fe-S cluster assembly ATPase SufC [Candidatus Calescibacterium sp.]MCX7972505.1 Fe-S cluster assembly ATPase SufC [bacterium]MDW8195603.1 Fe-S cluster assembly ATPase SufC [Candidatus Calescibacterium sp.]